MAEDLVRNANESSRSPVSQSSTLAPALWRPVDAADDMALVTEALAVLRDVTAKAAARQNEDPDSDDLRVELLVAVIAEYLRRERRDVFLTILNEHVATAIGRDTDYVWKSFTKLYRTCAGNHLVEAERAKVPLVMFSRCRGGGRNLPSVWQLWIQDGFRRTAFSLPELPYEADQPVLDKSLALVGAPPPSPETRPTPPKPPGEAGSATVSAPGRPSATNGPTRVSDHAQGQDEARDGAPSGNADAKPTTALPRAVVVTPPQAATRDILGYSIFSGLAMGGLALSAALLVLAAVAEASLADVAGALRDLFNFSWRGIRF